MSRMNTLDILKVLANEHRLKIVSWLKEPEKHFYSEHCDVRAKGVCVGLIEKKIGLSQSTVSQYLCQLKKSGVIEMTRVGQWTYCRLAPGFSEAFIANLQAQIA